MPLYQYLDALLDEIDSGVEAQNPPNNVYTAMEWAKDRRGAIRKYLARDHAARSRTRPAS